MTTTTTPSTVPSFDPQLLKLLAHQQQFSAKEYLQHAYFYNHPPPNAVATNLPRHLLGNGLSKLNTEKTFSMSNDKLDQQNFMIDCQKKKYSSQQTKDTSNFDQWLQPPPGSLIQGPVCLQSDTSSTDLKSETILSTGERISCFIVGGEKRLCLPEILNTVLKDFSLQEINAACERLHIYCSRCTIEQLDILKLTQVLPRTAPSCGLITQTDAERLCANLLQSRYKGQLRSINSLGINPYERLYSIKVQHKCFGKCSGIFYPTLYIAPQAECIQCDTCQALFSPKTFVSHGHKSEENRICHWGFNSDNWRAYLKIRSTEDLKAREELELFKDKFNNNTTQNKRFIQSQDVLSSTEKRTNHHSSYPQTAFSSSNKSHPTSLRVVRSNSPSLEQPTNPSIIHFNDFSPNGIRQILESTVSSSHARQRLLTYISQLQQAALKNQSNKNETQSNEAILLRRENELLRERLSKYQESMNGDLDDLESNISSSSSSITGHENKSNTKQPKYVDRKRRLLAAEQNPSKKYHPFKKACLDHIVDTLNQKAAQAEQEEEEDEQEKLVIIADNSLTPPATTPERKQEDVDIDDD